MNGTICPACGKVNEYANAEGYTEGAPRAYHAACWVDLTEEEQQRAIAEESAREARAEAKRTQHPV